MSTPCNALGLALFRPHQKREQKTKHPQKRTTSWWFQPLGKICSSKWESSSNRDENKKHLKPPPSIYTWNPNGAPCFRCKRPCFVELTFKNRGHLKPPPRQQPITFSGRLNRGKNNESLARDSLDEVQ